MSEIEELAKSKDQIDLWGGQVRNLQEQKKMAVSNSASSPIDIGFKEKRVTNLKKCLDFALQVQTTQKNIERSSDMLDSLNEKLRQNRAFIDLLSYLSDKYDCKPLKLTSQIIDFYHQNYQQQRVQQILKEKPNNLISHFLLEIQKTVISKEHDSLLASGKSNHPRLYSTRLGYQKS